MNAPAQGAAVQPGSEVHTIVGRGAHQRVWRRDHFVTLADGRVVNRPTGYTELATGMHYWENGEWKESRDEIEVTPTGAAATKGPHQVFLAGNINSPGAIEIITPDQHALKFRPVCLAYTNAATGQSVVLAPVRDAEGILFPPNQVLYPAAFSGVRADVRVSYTKAGFESDVILREQLPSPADYGLNPETTLLEVWHEADAPEPVKTPRTLDGLTDETLTFGTMRIGRGGAFALDGPLHRMSGAPVSKTWLRTENPARTYLIESVRYPRIRTELDQLPDRQASQQGVPGGRPEAHSRTTLLATLLPPPARASKAVRLAFDAQAVPPAKGLVLDYVIMNSQSEPLTLEGDTTYLVSDAVSLTDLIIEGGTVVKYDVGVTVYVEFYGTADCQTGPYRPAIFTARDDDTVGDIISGSTGTPSGYYGGVALMPQSAGNFLHDLRFSHQFSALIVGGDNEVRHAQFTHCAETVGASFCTLTLDNVLFYACEKMVFGFAGTTIEARHLTAQNCFTLAHAPDSDHAFNLTNSLLVNVTKWNTPGLGALNCFTNAVLKTTDASVLQTVGAAAQYLANGSPYRQAGVTAIPAALAADLRTRTTHPPVVWSNVALTTNVTLAPVVTRGGSVPDLGYCYAALDYVFGSNVLTNATLTLTAGTVLGTFTPGTNTQALLLQRGSSIVTRGEPTNLVRIVRYNTVQEESGGAWSSTNAGASLRTTAASPAPQGDFRGTEWSVPAGWPLHCDLTATNAAPFLFRDNQFSGGRFRASAAQVAFTNNLFQRVDGYCLEHPITVTNRWFNNTFLGGVWTFYNSGNGPWQVFNNAFVDTADLGSDAGVLAGYNAYLPGAPRATYWLSNDLVTNIVFQAGPLGRFYLTNSSPLTNRGSLSASDAGLYHFTTTTNQVKETNSTVDIGFHYLALTAADLPVDTDGDGLADYAEDANGNGTTDASETSVTSTDTDGDGRADAQELLLDGTDPTVFTPARLAYFPFNDTNWLGLAGQTPFAQSNAMSSDAWLSKGLQIANGTNGLLKYRETEADLNANLLLNHGAIRFWFKSTWDTGTGPGTPGRLIEVGTKGGTTTNGWWSLHFNTNATNLIFAAETNNVGTTYLTGTISWQRCDWNQLVLNYAATNSALYLNGSLISTGWGVTLWPGASVRAAGFAVGSDANGTNQAKGLFEDLEIFNHPLTTGEITENFETNRPPNAIAGLHTWFKAEAVITNVSGQIDRWLNQMCATNDAIQTGPLSKPISSSSELNGKAAVRFHTTNFFYLSNFPTNWTEAEAFLVLKAEADAGTSRGLWHLEASSGGNRYSSADGVVGDNFGRANETTASGNPSLSISQPHIYNVLTKPNEWTSRINGVIHYSTSSNVVGFPSSGAELGRNRFGDSFHGYIAEILFFNRVLNEPERKRVEVYLNQRYALVTSVAAVPTNLVANAVSPTQAGVSWNAVLGNTNVFFTVERKVVSGEFSAVVSLRNAGSFLDTALQTNTTYVYRVKAGNWAGDSTYSPETRVTTATNGADIPVSTLKLWLKADSGRGANPIPLWADQSGNGAHASQHIKNRRGMAVENAIATNKPVMGFFTTNSFYLRSLGHGSWTSAEAYVVLKTRQTNTLNEVWGFGSAGGLWYPHPTGLIYDNFFRSLNANSTTLFPQTSLQAFHLYSPTSTSNLWSSRINGALYASTNNTYESFTLPTIGIAGNSQPWDGDMAELLIFNQPLTSGERTAVENYLNNRYFLW